jgi:hypothetical protein
MVEQSSLKTRHPVVHASLRIPESTREDAEACDPDGSRRHIDRQRLRPIQLALLVGSLSIGAVDLAGCTTRVGTFTMVTTKNYQTDVKYKLVGRMEGSDSVPIVLFIPFGVSELDAAVDHCVEKGNGVYVANAVVESHYWTAILFGAAGYRVTGDVYAPVTAAERDDPGVDKFELVKAADESLKMRSTSGAEEAVLALSSSQALRLARSEPR